MRVLGIDPSIRCTGLALVVDGSLRASRIQTVRPRGLRAQRDQIRRIVGGVMKFAGPVDLAVIEAMYVPRDGGQAGAVIARAWLWGLVVDQLMERCDVVEVTTKQRAKYATSNGNADKAAVAAAVQEAFPNIRPRDDNEADAIALAAMGARFLGAPIDGPPTPEQSQVMAAVAWPNQKKEQ